MRKIIEMTLAGDQITVTAVPDASAALAFMQRWKPQVLVADANLEGTDGYRLAEAVRHDAALADVGILLLCNANQPLDAQRARSAEVNDHLNKPFDSQALIDKVRQLGAPRTSDSHAVQTPTNPSVGGHSPALGASSAIASGASSAMASDSPPINMAGPGLLPGELDVPLTVDNGLGSYAPPSPAPREDDFGIPLELSFQGADSDVPQRPSWRPPPQSGHPPNSTVPRNNPAPQSDSMRRTQELRPSGAAPRNSPLPSNSLVPRANNGSSGHRYLGDDFNANLRAFGLNDAQIREVMALSEAVVERVAWEIIPELAETIIREEIRRLTAET